MQKLNQLLVIILLIISTYTYSQENQNKQLKNLNKQIQQLGYYTEEVINTNELIVFNSFNDTSKIYFLQPSKELFNNDQTLFALSIDPLAVKFPSMSPYNAMGNNPINMIDPDGREVVTVQVGGGFQFYGKVDVHVLGFAIDDRGKVAWFMEAGIGGGPGADAKLDFKVSVCNGTVDNIAGWAVEFGATVTAIGGGGVEGSFSIPTADQIAILETAILSLYMPPFDNPFPQAELPDFSQGSCASGMATLGGGGGAYGTVEFAYTPAIVDLGETGKLLYSLLNKLYKGEDLTTKEKQKLESFKPRKATAFEQGVMRDSYVRNRIHSCVEGIHPVTGKEELRECTPKEIERIKKRAEKIYSDPE